MPLIILHTIVTFAKASFDATGTALEIEDRERRVNITRLKARRSIFFSAVCVVAAKSELVAARGVNSNSVNCVSLDDSSVLEKLSERLPAVIRTMSN